MKGLFSLIILSALAAPAYPATVNADFYFTWVDTVNVREKPGLDGKVIATLKEGEEILFLGYKTAFTTKLTLRGRDLDRPWGQFRLPDGKTGWVYTGAVLKKDFLGALCGMEYYKSPGDTSHYFSLVKRQIVRYTGRATEEKYPDGKGAKSMMIEVIRSDGITGWVFPGDFRNLAPLDSPVNIKAGMKSGDIEDIFLLLTNGQKVVFQPGTYRITGGLEIRRLTNVTIECEGKADILLEDPLNDVISVFESGGITFRNLHVAHVRNDYDNHKSRTPCCGFVIDAGGCGALTFENCELNGCGSVGIYGSGIEDLTVSSCNIHNNSCWAMMLSDVGRLTVTNCEIAGNGCPILFGSDIISNDGGHDGCSLSGNQFTGNGTAVSYEEGD